MMVLIHKSDTYTATFTDRESSTVIVTFDFFDMGKSDFKQPVTRVGGCDDSSNLHISSKTNDWYTSEGRAQLVDDCVGILSKYSRIICFGFSMGAHAAVLFGSLFRAHRIVAISPRIQLDPEQPPFDKRNIEFVQKCNFEEGDLRKIADPSLEFIVVYDPFSFPDASHAKLFKEHFPGWHYLPFPFSGHNSLQPAKDVKKLRPMMRHLVLGDVPLSTLHKMYKSFRRESVYYWYHQLLHQRCRSGIARAAAAFMIDHPGTNNAMLFKLGERLMQAGEYESGLYFLRKAYYFSKSPPQSWTARLAAHEIRFVKLTDKRRHAVLLKRRRSRNVNVIE